MAAAERPKSRLKNVISRSRGGGHSVIDYIQLADVSIADGRTACLGHLVHHCHFKEFFSTNWQQPRVVMGETASPGETRGDGVGSIPPLGHKHCSELDPTIRIPTRETFILHTSKSFEDVLLFIIIIFISV